MLRKLIWLKKVKIGINEAIKQNEIINNNLKYKSVQVSIKMKSYCCRKKCRSVEKILKT